MNKIILAFCLLATFASCKKDDDNDPNCERTIAGIAASYKLTKVVVTLTGIPDQDVTTSITTDCQRNGVYQLKSDKTVTYTESGTCSDNGTGTWDIVSGKFTAGSDGGSFDFNDLDIAAWDCSTLTLSQDNGSGSSTKYYLSKQ